MKKTTRLLALLLAAGMTLGAALTTAYAEDAAPLVDECFDDYDVDYDGKSTTLFPTFVVEANSIGEGYVKVTENAENGNLHLTSHVFTQIYTAEPIKGAYTFSLDVFQTQGDRNCAIFLRAPQCGKAAYYEHDASEDFNAACRTGIVINCHGTRINVNIKSYGIRAVESDHILQNMFSFDLPEGVSIGRDEYTNLKVVDTGTELSIFVADHLICRIALSDPSAKGYSRANVSELCYRNAVLYDAAGTELATIEDPVVQAEGSTLGWATRVANMIVDNVYLAPLSEGNTGDTTPDESETDGETLPESNGETIGETDRETVVESDDESETTAVTAADTAAESKAETEAPAGGCASTVTAGSLLVLLGGAFITLKKKH